MNYPTIHRSTNDIPFIYTKASEQGWIGIDLEWTPDEVPTLVSFSAQGHAVSVAWDLGWSLVKECLRDGLKMVGHAITDADRPIIERNLGARPYKLNQYQDTMIWHYLCNAEFCKAGGKGKDDKESRGAGYMDLWTMASLYTDLPQWKRCRGNSCVGPCPDCDHVGYNAVDAVAVDLAYEPLMKDALDKDIPVELYNHVQQIAALGHKMKTRGVKIDRPYVDGLEASFIAHKKDLFPSHFETKGKSGKTLKNPRKVWDAPFNPMSPKEPIEWFAEWEIDLPSTSLVDIQRVLKGRDFEDVHEFSKPSIWLNLYASYKAAGKGLSSWFDERYMDALGYCHPRIIACGTSTGRLASASPNFQNIPARGFGKDVRRAIIPRSPDLKILKADSRQLELRMCLWASGVREDFGDDAFMWLVQKDPEMFEEAAHLAGRGMTPRDIAKRVSHAGDYLEGVMVLSGVDLQKSYTRQAVRAGALVIYEDWEYGGGYVAFTGTNLARALYGDATFANRKKALQIQEAYFGRFKQIRQWHRAISVKADGGFVQSVTGRYLKLRGTAEEKIKIAAAFYGQGQASEVIQDAMLALDQAGHTPILMVHDEIVVEVPKEWKDKRCYDLMQMMAEPDKRLDGFSCPIKVEVGDNWLDCREINV